MRGNGNGKPYWELHTYVYTNYCAGSRTTALDICVCYIHIYVCVSV